MTTAAVSASRTDAGRRAAVSPFLVAAELGLAALTLAAVVGFRRVFVDWGFLVPMVAVAVTAHLLAVVGRRRALSVPATALLSVVVVPFVLTPTLFPSTGILGVVPTPDTLTAATDALRTSWHTFQTISAPAPSEPGFVLAACLAVLFAAFLADWAAFRLWSPIEASVPATTLFVFCSLLGATDHQVSSTGLFLAAVLGFVLLHRAARLHLHAGWLAADATRGSLAMTRSGALLTVGALAVALVLGPHLPGADSKAVISVRSAQRSGTNRVTVSPLVDIQDRLTKQPVVEVFSVKANQPEYWRMTALDTFEGEIWKSGGKYATASGDLDSSLPQGVQGTAVDQTYRIEALKVLWMPAAFQPQSIDAPDVDVRYQAESGTLIVDTNRNDSDNIGYRVRSTVPAFTPEQLRPASGAAVPPEVAARYLQLPSDFSGVARRTAEEVTSGKATPYDKARALQDFFRDGSFTYDLTVPKGHGESAIEQFLRDKRGYCEQFAGTYAAMARAIGLPARVAVGFTPGDPDPVDPTLYHVRGEHAHAWPEVWLGSAGWVPFEPTPNRGAPNAEAWTGARPQQATGSSDVGGSTTTVTSPDVTAATPDSLPTPSVTSAPLVEAGGAADATGDEGWAWPLQAALVGLALLAVAAVYAAVVTWLLARRIHRRREAAHDAGARVRVAWEESVEALAAAGTPVWVSETHREYAARAADRLPTTVAPLLAGLAEDVDAASYAPDQLDVATVERADRASAAVIASVEAADPAWVRFLRGLDPRPLLRRPGPGRHRAGSARD